MYENIMPPTFVISLLECGSFFSKPYFPSTSYKSFHGDSLEPIIPRWWQLKYLFFSTPIPGKKMIQFDLRIFFSWFNHQVDTKHP